MSSSLTGCESIQRACSCDLCFSHECHCPLEATVTLNPGFSSEHRIESACLEVVPCLNLLSAVRTGRSLVERNRVLPFRCRQAVCTGHTKADGRVTNDLASCFQNLQGNVSTSLWMAQDWTGPLWGYRNCLMSSLPACCDTWGQWLKLTLLCHQVSSAESPTSMTSLPAFSVDGGDFSEDLHVPAYFLLIYVL